MERLSARELVRRFLSDRGDEGFAIELALRATESMPVAAGELVLDVGAGPGHYANALARRGVDVVAVELVHEELAGARTRAPRPVVGDARRLPVGGGVFDGVVCSNMLEHTPEPLAVIDELHRVVRPGGWCWVSWTNWLSPFGGHAIAPLHYLGAERGLRVYRRVLGEPRGPNLPHDGVWPLHIATVLAHLDARPGWEVECIRPRYWPRLAPIMAVPGVREVLAWNCEIHLRRR